MKKKNIPEIKVMIADDVQTYRDVLTKILKKIGITQITEAVNGEVAWDKIIIESKGVEEFDLVISDINMPRMSGLELLKNIRNHGRTADMPVILVSTENERDVILEAILNGVSDYLVKPYDAELAIKKIQAVITKNFN